MRIPYFFLGRIEQGKPVDRESLLAEEIKILEDFTPVHYEKNLEEIIKDIRSDAPQIKFLYITPVDYFININ